MAGFFKKLFNRITGKPNEKAKPDVVEQAALPAPEVVEIITPVALPVPEPEVTPEPKKSAVKKALPKKVETKKTEKKKPEVKKPEQKKIELKGSEPKKIEVKKPESKKIEVKNPAAKVEVKKPQAKVEIPKTLKPLKLTTIAPPPSPLPPPAPVVKIAPASAPLPASAPAPVAEVPQRSGWFSRLKQGLSKSSSSIGGSITSIFTKKKLDKATLQDLEDTLIQADLGLTVAERITAQVSHGRYDKEIDPEEVKQILAAEVARILKPVEVPFNFGSEKPFVIAVVGVNGSGKTTTIGKLGAIAAGEGFKVMFAAGDTFRAAAIEQLTVWGKRIGAETISRPTGADAAGLAFDALKEAQESGADILFIDTAGRLQNKAHLMDELDKMVRVIKKLDPTAPHAVLLVLDATTGQNALAQAEIFTKVAGVTGLIMTKLDGTARGGILVAIAEKFKLPIHAIGVGESIEDLQPFDADGFARAIAGLDEK
jgi:fused signal recognition particle receptor